MLGIEWYWWVCIFVVALGVVTLILTVIGLTAVVTTLQRQNSEQEERIRTLEHAVLTGTQPPPPPDRKRNSMWD